MFNEQLPKWEAQGVEPPESKKVTGYQPKEKPPSDWFNWFFNRIYKVLQEIRNTVYQKSEVDSNIKAHADVTTGAHGATSAATANAIIQRDANGQANVGTPTAASHIARKQDVDSVSSAVGSANDAAAAAQRTANNALTRANTSLPMDGTGSMTGVLKTQTIDSTTLTTTRKQLMNSNNSEIYVGNDSAKLTLESSQDPFLLRAGQTFKFWHSGNMGTGSGLNADMLNNLHATDFVRINSDNAMNAGISLKPTTNQIGDSTGSKATFEVKGAGGANDAAFIQFHRPNSFACYFGIDKDNKLKIGGWSNGTNAYDIWHAGNMGAGSGLDSDTLDSLQPSYAAVGNTVVTRGGSGEIHATNFTANGTSADGTGRYYIGDDAFIEDFNTANAFRVVGRQNAATADIYCGTNNYKVWHTRDLRINNGVPEFNINGTWVPSGGIKKVQRGLLTHSSAGVEITQDIGQVNPNNAYVIISYTGEYSTYAINSDIRARIIDSGADSGKKVAFYKRSANPVEIAWQVVEFN
ncbi:hypothetical protein [Paenibacillus sp. 32352]|uniref:hypothetical protein n=1 Tax=Paenibacillus sp. 32352 TaxID=1969111 RepID=UPI0009AE469D|nr:hypothetical protein [Paenibacillus sp. 32352]